MGARGSEGERSAWRGNGARSTMGSGAPMFIPTACHWSAWGRGFGGSMPPMCGGAGGGLAPCRGLGRAAPRRAPRRARSNGTHRTDAPLVGRGREGETRGEKGSKRPNATKPIAPRDVGEGRAGKARPGDPAGGAGERRARGRVATEGQSAQGGKGGERSERAQSPAGASAGRGKRREGGRAPRRGRPPHAPRNPPSAQGARRAGDEGRIHKGDRSA